MNDARTQVGTSLVAGISAVAASYAVAGLTAAFVGAPVSKLLTVSAPGSVVTFAIQNLGSLGQPLVLASAIALAVVLFAAASLVGTLLEGRFGRPAGLAVGVGLAFGLAISLTNALVPSLAAGLALGATRVVVEGGVGLPEPETVSPGRRRVLGALAALAVSALAVTGRVFSTEQRSAQGEPAETGGTSGATGTAGGSSTSGDQSADGGLETQLLALADEQSFHVGGLEGLVSDKFYQVDINNVDPEVDAASWTLSVTGAVERERSLTFDELTAMPAQHRFITLRCVGESLNGHKMDNALWTGVPLGDVLDSVGVTATDEACCVQLRAADDYFEEFPLSALRNGFLAYRMNGRPLPKQHGFPVRVLIPGHWGEINVKWVTEIEVTESPMDGYWEKRGWHGTGPVNTVAKLHSVKTLSDGRVELAGHAYAGTRDVERVEVSIDAGETWETASLTDPLPGAVPADATTLPEDLGVAEDAWRMWRHVYETDGRHDVLVRAVDGTGATQSREQSNSFPSGATGWVSRTVNP